MMVYVEELSRASTRPWMFSLIVLCAILLFFAIKAARQGSKAPRGKKSDRFTLSFLLIFVSFILFAVAPLAVEAVMEAIHRH